jgi:hypothetical protein
MENQFALSRVVKVAFTDRTAARQSIARILRWDFERITLCHGSIVEEDAQEKFRASYEFLG